MADIKKRLHAFQPHVQSITHIANTGPVAWSLILFPVVLSTFALLLSGTNTLLFALSMGGNLVGLIIGALLRARRGALLVWFLTSVIMLCADIFKPGMAPPGGLSGYITMTLVLFMVALISGQMRSLGMRLKQAHNTLLATHTELEVAYATIQKQALTDGLTGLPNHRAIMEQFHKELERARRYHRSLSILFFDADRFKRVNDTYGHAVGDTVLRQIGERANSTIRGGDTVGRFGGEEFVILLPEADPEEARTVAEWIRTSVAAEPVATSEMEGGIAATVSIGLSTYPLDGESEQTLLSQADEAMYIAKRMGRNQVRTAEEARRIGEDAELMALLQEAEQSEGAQREGVTSEQLRETHTLRMIYSLLSLLERRDEGQEEHAYAVSDLATAIAEKMGVASQIVPRVGMAALLHDIGKVAMPDKLLQKASPLSPQERVLLLDHTTVGAQILEGSLLLTDLVPAVRHHHEHWDGSGSPDHLSGEDIPLVARIIAVAEAYDFMQREHPYQFGSSAQFAFAELQRCAGTQFDPAVVQAITEILSNQQEQQLSIQAERV
jgi:two-component system, cell cycle response regulator